MHPLVSYQSLGIIHIWRHNGEIHSKPIICWQIWPSLSFMSHSSPDGHCRGGLKCLEITPQGGKKLVAVCSGLLGHWGYFHMDLAARVLQWCNQQPHQCGELLHMNNFKAASTWLEAIKCQLLQDRGQCKALPEQGAKTIVPIKVLCQAVGRLPAEFFAVGELSSLDVWQRRDGLVSECPGTML